MQYFILLRGEKKKPKKKDCLAALGEEEIVQQPAIYLDDKK